jgi:hypothetical protein
MVSWNSISPDGTKSVKSNKVILQENTTYIETVLPYDHFWDESANKDGHHQFTQMPGYETAGLPDDPAFANVDMSIIYYGKEKTAAESTAQQDVQPFARVSTNVMQLLGMRSCGVINVAATVPTIVYKHNVLSVTRSSKGRYDVLFEVATPMPSINYMVIGGGVGSNTAQDQALSIYVSVTGNTPNVITRKSTTGVQLSVTNQAGALVDPIQFWFTCYGG